MKKSKADKIVSELLVAYADAKPALHFSSAYELLIAVILSAQCTDERVNIVTDELFKEYNTPQKMLALGSDKLSEKIYSIGLYRNKAKNIILASKSIVDNFGGNVPQTLEELRTLSGVGRKTANVVYAQAFNGDAIAVDTHVFRVSNRLGLAHASTPEKTEDDLMKIIDRDKWSRCHLAILYHGRRVCKPKPDCKACFLNCLCEKNIK